MFVLVLLVVLFAAAAVLLPVLLFPVLLVLVLVHEASVFVLAYSCSRDSPSGLQL